MLNFVICDDHEVVLNKLYKMLESIFINNNIDAQIGLKTTTPEEVLKYTSSNHVDVLLLDINLNANINGCDLAQEIRKANKDAYIIFTTGHLEYALLAYKYKTFDYLAKPIIKERLEKTIIRLIEDITYTPNHYINLNNKLVLNPDDIDYIKKDGMKLVFCTKEKNYEYYSSFNKINTCLPENFCRCHKSYIVNVNNISNLDSLNNLITFKDTGNCYIGSKYKKEILEVFNYGNFSKSLDNLKLD